MSALEESRSMIDPPVPFFVARQPIWDSDRKLAGFEILFRRQADDLEAKIDDGSAATARVLVEGVIVGGLATLTGGLPAWINVTRELLTAGVSSALRPSESFVLEILEDVAFDAEVLRASQVARREGFLIALDDVTSPDRICEAQGVAQIAKVDFRAVGQCERKVIIACAQREGLKVVAEKVETDLEVQEAESLGVDFFQGYAVGRPTNVRRSGMYGSSAQHIRLLEVVSEPYLNLNRLEDVVQSDPSLTYKLLAFANSVAAAQVRSVSSIRQALVLLGDHELRRISMLVFLGGLTGRKAGYDLVQSLSHGMFCESLAVASGNGPVRGKYLLVGSLSRVDLLTGMPLAQALERLPLAPEIEAAILQERGPLGAALQLVGQYEQGHWARVSALSAEVRVDEDRLPGLYCDSIERAQAMLRVA